MRRAHIVLGVAAVAAVAAAPTSFAAMRPVTATVPPPATGSAAERFGSVRYDGAARRWVIAASATERADGLTGVSCSPATGILTVSFSALGTVGTYVVDEDDAYAGRYHAGASATTQRLTVTFRKASSGAVVPCHSGALRIPGSSVQIWVRGTAATPTPPTSPPPPSTTLPTALPTAVTTRPTPPAPPPATTPPVDPTILPPPVDETDPADQ